MSFTRPDMQIAKVIALPGENRPVRFPSFPALERTAMMRFNASIPVTINAGQTKMAMFRSATYPLWGEALVSSASAYSASYLCSPVGQVASAASTKENMTVEVMDLCGVNSASGAKGANNPAITAGSYPVPDAILGMDIATGQNPFIYVPQGSYLLVVTGPTGMSGTTSTTKATVTFEEWTGPGNTEYYAQDTITFSSDTLGAAGTPFGPTDNKWIRPSSVAFTFGSSVSGSGYTPVISLVVVSCLSTPTYTANSAMGTVSPVGGASNSKHFMPRTISPEYKNSVLPWAATRLNAVAALFTNTTKVMNKEGTVLWGRINPCLISPYKFAESDLAGLHPAEKRYMGLETGCYVYNPPSTDLNTFQSYFHDVGLSGVVSYQNPVMRLDSDAFVAAGVFSDADGGTNLAVNLDYHIEFRTSSTLFDIGVSNFTLEALHMAQVQLLKAGFFHPNDNHVSVITRIISGLASLHPLLAVAAPLAQGLMGASSVALSKSTKGSRPKTTTAVKAGYDGPVGTRSVTRGRSRSRRKGTAPRTAARLPPFKKGKVNPVIQREINRATVSYRR